MGSFVAQMAPAGRLTVLEPSLEAKAEKGRGGTAD